MSEDKRLDPNSELVEVFDTQQESEAMVIQGLLDSAGLESLMTNLDAPQDVLPGVGGVILRVRPEDADVARRIIEEYHLSAEAELAADEAPENG